MDLLCVVYCFDRRMPMVVSRLQQFWEPFLGGYLSSRLYNGFVLWLATAVFARVVSDESSGDWTGLGL